MSIFALKLHRNTLLGLLGLFFGGMLWLCIYGPWLCARVCLWNLNPSRFLSKNHRIEIITNNISKSFRNFQRIFWVAPTSSTRFPQPQGPHWIIPTQGPAHIFHHRHPFMHLQLITTTMPVTSQWCSRTRSRLPLTSTQMRLTKTCPKRWWPALGSLGYFQWSQWFFGEASFNYVDAPLVKRRFPRPAFISRMFHHGISGGKTSAPLLIGNLYESKVRRLRFGIRHCGVWKTNIFKKWTRLTCGNMAVLPMSDGNVLLTTDPCWSCPI